MPRIRKSLSPETVNVALSAVDALIETNRTDVAVAELAPLFNARAELLTLGAVETENEPVVKRRRSAPKAKGGSAALEDPRVEA